MKADIKILFIFAGIIILGLAVFLFEKNPAPPPHPSENEIRLFYSNDCPFCLEVEEYIEKNKIEEKIYFEKKEISLNEDNFNELVEKAGRCGISPEKIEIPLLWTGSECQVGYSDIIKFFDEKIKKEQ